MTERFKLVLLIGNALLACVFVLAAAPTLVQWSIGGFQDHELFASTSPDGRYRIDGFVSVDFPANELLDPSGTVRITVWESRTGSLSTNCQWGCSRLMTFRSRQSAGSQTGECR